MTPIDLRSQNLTLILRISAGVVSLFGLHDLAHADTNPVLRDAVVVAQSEADVADANVTIIRQRTEALRALEQIDAASWLEVQLAEADHKEAVEKVIALRKLVKWLESNQDAVAGHDAGFSPSVSRPSLVINLSLPGSHAILGWVDVSCLEEPLKTQALDLLEARTSLSSNCPTQLAVERNRITRLEEQIDVLERAEHKHAVEIDRLKLQKKAAVSTCFLIEAQARLQETENQSMLERISAIRVTTGATTAAEQANPATYNEALFNLLGAESKLVGQVKLTETLQEWSTLSHHAHRSLNRSGLSSAVQLARTRRELQDTMQNLEATRDLQQWRIDWLKGWSDFDGRLTHDQLTHDQFTERETEALTSDVLRNPELLRMSVELYREFVLLQAQLKSLQLRDGVQRELSEHLNEQTTANQAELQQATLMSKLLINQVELVTEQMQVVQFALASLPELAVAQKITPMNVIHVDDEATQLILFASRRRRELASQRQGLLMEQRLGKQTERVKRLFEMGYASRLEVLDVEQHLLEAKDVSEAESASRTAVEIDCRLLEAILTSSDPESAVTSSSPSAVQ